MASSTQATIKQESSASSSSNSEETKSATTVKEEYSFIAKPEDETFEQFYSEVNNHILSINSFSDCLFFI